MRSLWPKELTDIEFESSVSRSVISYDRMISGHCECCVTFEFKVHRKQDGARSEQLEASRSITRHQREALVRIAKRFASASGINQAELASVGLNSEKSFQWQVTDGQDRILHTLELRFIRTSNTECQHTHVHRGRKVLRR